LFMRVIVAWGLVEVHASSRMLLSGTFLFWTYLVLLASYNRVLTFADFLCKK